MQKTACHLVGILLLLLAQPGRVFSQDVGNPYSGEIVHVDSSGKTDKGVPFDRSFYLQRDKILTTGIETIQLYRVKYEKGSRVLFPDKHDKRLSTPDYIFKKPDIFAEKDKLTLLVPPLKPNRDFDILVLRGVSGDNYTGTLEINEMLFKGPLTFVMDGGEQRIQAGPVLQQKFGTLKDATNNNPADKTARNVFPTSVNEFYDKVTLPTKDYYTEAVNDANLHSTSFLPLSDIQSIEKAAPVIHRHFSDTYILEQIDYKSNFDRILKGYLPIEDASAEEADPFDLKARIANITGSLLFFDTLRQSLGEMVIIDQATFSPVRHVVEQVAANLDYNKAFLSARLKNINKVIQDSAREAVWLMGDTRSKDLQTRGSSIFTLDLGIANLWARDLDDKTVYIPKLYYGVNIYFRPVDKNVRERYLPGKNQVPEEGHDLISRRTIWQRLCLTAGFTIGSLDKDNFDNFFGGSSLLLGPGYRITRSLRISTGICFLKRSSLNLLITEKKFTSGYYLTASIDFDLLGTLGKVTGIFLK